MRFQSAKKIILLAPLFLGLFFGCKSTEESDQDGVIVTEPIKTDASSAENLTLEVKVVYFDYDKSDVKGDFQADLSKVASFLEKMPNATLELEGHCDERGSTQYNLALGQRRADSVKSYLITLGVAESRLKATSYGEERLLCKEDSEECHAKNRRVTLKVVA